MLDRSPMTYASDDCEDTSWRLVREGCGQGVDPGRAECSLAAANKLNAWAPQTREGNKQLLASWIFCLAGPLLFVS